MLLLIVGDVSCWVVECDNTVNVRKTDFEVFNFIAVGIGSEGEYGPSLEHVQKDNIVVMPRHGGKGQQALLLSVRPSVCLSVRRVHSE